MQPSYCCIMKEEMQSETETMYYIGTLYTEFIKYWIIRQVMVYMVCILQRVLVNNAIVFATSDVQSVFILFCEKEDYCLPKSIPQFQQEWIQITKCASISHHGSQEPKQHDQQLFSCGQPCSTGQCYIMAMILFKTICNNTEKHQGA